MKYSIITVINGNFKIEKESGDNLETAKTQYHQTCAALHNDKDTAFKGIVKLMDENLDVVDGLFELIDHSNVSAEA